MLKGFWVFLIFILFFGLYSCDNGDSIEVEATIIAKTERQGGYYFDLEYELEGFSQPLTAQELVKKRIYDQYDVGDVYIFKRPAPSLPTD